MEGSQGEDLGWFTREFYSWLHPFVWNTSDGTLDPLSNAPVYYDAAADYEAWRLVWAGMRQRQGETEQLLKESFLQLFRQEYWAAFYLHFVGIQLNAFSPLFLYFLFISMSREGFSGSTFFWAIIIVGTRLLRAFLNFAGQNRLYQLGQRIYSCLAQAIIDKVLCTSLAGEKENLVGTEIAKLMHLDIQKLLLFGLKRSYVTNNSISVLSTAFVLVCLMRWVGLFGFVLLFVNFLFFVFAFKCMESYEVALAQNTDTRVKKSMQVFEMIKYIKIGALQSYFYNKLAQLRETQLSSLRKTLNLELVPVFVIVVSTKIIVLTVCLLLISSHQDFNPSIMFVCFLIFSNLTFIKIAKDVSFIKQTSIAFKTIQRFLQCSEIDKSFLSHDRFRLTNEGETVLHIRGDFFWGKTGDENKGASDELREINFSLKKGELKAVVGPYGSGKSSLIMAALGELNPRPSASVKLSGSLAYVGQRPWIINDTVRANILFGEPFSEERYRKAVSGACLQADLRILEAGDATLIGQRGCTLSGGQKLRVSLARALYSSADVLLLDDILSAVDAHVGAHIFFETLRKQLRGRSIVLVTHALSFLPHCDSICLMEDGRIVATGTFQQLSNHPTLTQIHHAKPKEGKNVSTIGDNKLLNEIRARQEEQLTNFSDMDDLNLYFQRNGKGFIVGTLLFFVLNTILHTALLFWMNQWARSHQGSASMFIFIYLMLSLVAGVVAICFSHFLHMSPIFKELHSDMVESLLRSSLEYFQQTNSARIIGVLSGDLRTNDRILGFCYMSFTIYTSAFASNILTILVAAALMGNYIFMANQIVFLPILTYLCGKFLLASRKFSGYQHQTKIPVNNAFDEALDGISTIRAHGKEGYQTSLFINNLNRYLGCNLMAKGLTTSTEFATTLSYIAFFIISLIILKTAGHQITYDCVLLACMYRGEEVIIATYNNIIEFLVHLKSLRKCEQLTRLQGETGLELIRNDSEEESTSQLLPLSTRPSPFPHTQIEFRDFSARYRGRSTNVLSGVSFTVRAGEKVGVVGRTGSGKSTLILSLMRSIECAGGSILVGGKDIAAVPLSELRSAVSVVLQEHFLFAGTVRENVDPTHAFSDAAVEAALAKSGLWEALRKRGGLSAEVAERGGNLSAGEKQLLNVARALLTPKGIVLMDEATASIDAATDEAVQRAMRREFAECTVLTIAHRISTVLDYDRILVLEAGRVAEFGPPSVLIAQPNSLFKQLCDEAGAKIKPE